MATHKYTLAVQEDEVFVQQIRGYILENPLRWTQDKFYRRY